MIKSIKKALAITVLGTAVLAQMSCEKDVADVKANMPEPGVWVVDLYNDFNAGLFGGAAEAGRLCEGPVGEVVWMDMSGTFKGKFYKNGSSSWSHKVDGRSLVFAKNPPGYSEEKGTTTVYRQYDQNVRSLSQVVDYRVRTTAGNEAGINIIPKENFVTTEHDPIQGYTKLTKNHLRDKRWIRIRTDYAGQAYDTNNQPMYDSYGNSVLAIYTDLYQIDCVSGSQRASGEAGKSAAPAPTPIISIMAKNVLASELPVGASVPAKHLVNEAWTYKKFENVKGKLVDRSGIAVN